MEKIPTQTENPNGLHGRYLIQKLVKNPDYGVRVTDTFMGEDNTPEFITEEVDKGSEYFVMRLDAGGKDKKHVNACRKAVLHYAELIKDHLPKLSKDLINRYSEEA